MFLSVFNYHWVFRYVGYFWLEYYGTMGVLGVWVLWVWVFWGGAFVNTYLSQYEAGYLCYTVDLVPFCEKILK